MFKIGEFSKLTQVSIRMLRYYDEVGLLKPEQVDPFTGYRLYSVEQIPVLNKIVFLRDVGFNISEIAVVMSKWNDAFVTEQLEQKSREIEQNIQEEQQRLAKIKLAKADINRDKIQIHYNVSIKDIPSYQVVSIRRVIPDYYGEGQLWKELSAFAEERQLVISNNTFSIYHDTEYKETEVDVEVCAQTTSVGESEGDFAFRMTEPVPYMASTMVYGEFTNIAKAYLAFANWLSEHNQYEMAGGSRQIVHRGPWNEENPEKYLTEIQVALKKRDMSS
ncbi:MerR family transcriptional regulator [Ohessyouella blattaphilus]|uniref:MerR family transcriptional regulator n=1 Tax=Ohessyouella blattaphilus TaxID=2949333 RepID=A0ABT1EFN7_9FIRM|nr:MerR family transcriptional regulator [Ohessyouella blattaphilus]MCP1109520.1 MerR family transcriptional regulator [Ohessyouella blattaphilus]MCR8562914.1 MerR family transcriptional regulator [Ohessyouella blattaphilus]MDL2250092.1 MerR family transcriptional regulator [Lachnospiraceae bacterium OttesenSCG-928-J05]